MLDVMGRGTPEVHIDYVEIVDGETLTPLVEACDGALALVAVRIGRTRLIDNTVLSGGPHCLEPAAGSTQAG
jgi:pantothenate synthetase